MKALHLLLLVAFFTPAWLLRAADPAPAVATPATAAEVAYWKKLQAELIAYRAANGAYAARNFMEFSVVQLNEIMARTEKFLDARDGDAVEGLGADLVEYRQQLIAMLDNALTPLRLTAAGHATKAGSANMNPQATMENFLRAGAQFRTVDGYKAPLHRLHLAIDNRIVAAGGPRIIFFRSLNLGDSANYEYAAATPAQRDAKFIAASAAIHPALGVLAEQKFIRYRLDGRLDEQILEKRDQLLANALEINQQTAGMSEAQLEQQLAGIPGDAPAEERALFEFVIALERRKRSDSIGYSVMLENWKAVFAQWLGKADDAAVADGCNDLAIAADGSWAATTGDGLGVEARDLATGAVVFRARSEFPIRGLTAGADGRLYAFTTGGTLVVSPAAGGTEVTFEPLNRVSYQMLVGAIAAATARERFVYAWGAAPALADAGKEMLFKANSSSRVTAVAMDRAGRHALIAFSGLNDTGDGKVRHGFDILSLPESSDDLAKLSVESRSFNPAFAAPVNAIAVTEGAGHVVLAAGSSSFGSVEVFHFLDPLKPQITQLALDNQPYTFVGFAGEGDAPVVVAGTRQGVIRVWSGKSGDLLARYVVPSGAQGIAMALHGGELITANLGSPGLYRWSAADGRLLATLDGDVPAADAATLAAALAAEQARRPIIAKFLTMRDTEDPAAKVAYARQFLVDDGVALEAAGLKEFVLNTVRGAREAELAALNKAKRFPETLQLGRQSLQEGVNTRNIYFYMLVAANRSRPPGAEALFAEALAAYPQSTDLAYLNHRYRSDMFSRAGNIDAAMKEIDAMDLLQPEDAPHANSRQVVLFDAADAAYKAGNHRLAIEHYIKSLDYCRTKEDQMNVLPSVFSLAYGLSDWNLCTRVASAIIEMEPAKKNDKQFMDAARYAYQMTQQGK
ncbi:hypothetical protein Verru16b_00312 [Lacunisphaera limnophila]|uniref:Anaphase-promoting complex, cyclosome, subunit 3 n=1 Tax=Lacunisphaera limnophila TaxID=1838286 RepID=A0A1I7PI16_9BACT|nr:hypothetical protein [Lacunisphaera limnophila]AOS43269.1 hypothetical protein Verru16b_00312 [Lacunisphaera limnophila]